MPPTDALNNLENEGEKILGEAEAAAKAFLTGAEQVVVDLFNKVVLPAAAQEAQTIVDAVAAAPTNTGQITQLIAAGQANVIAAAEQNGIAAMASDAVLAFGNALKALTPIPVTTAAGAAPTPPIPVAVDPNATLAMAAEPTGHAD